jgi:saccharopine dehydrogenase-like NADP-dependent oxidoreductase
LPNEHLRIPDLAERTYREVVEMFLPLSVTGPKVEARVGRFLGVSPTGRIMQNLKWLGLLSEEKTGCDGDTSAAMLVHLLEKKLRLEPGQQDLVVLVHELDVEYPGLSRRPERITSTLVARGEPGGFTAMAKTVGLPTALAVKLLLRGELSLRGSQIPTHPSIYDPILAELASVGLVFEENTSEIV